MQLSTPRQVEKMKRTKSLQLSKKLPDQPFCNFGVFITCYLKRIMRCFIGAPDHPHPPLLVLDDALKLFTTSNILYNFCIISKNTSKFVGVENNKNYLFHSGCFCARSRTGARAQSWSCWIRGDRVFFLIRVRKFRFPSNFFFNTTIYFRDKFEFPRVAFPSKNRYHALSPRKKKCFFLRTRDKIYTGLYIQENDDESKKKKKKQFVHVNCWPDSRKFPFFNSEAIFFPPSFPIIKNFYSRFEKKAPHIYIHINRVLFFRFSLYLVFPFFIFSSFPPLTPKAFLVVSPLLLYLFFGIDDFSSVSVYSFPSSQNFWVFAPSRLLPPPHFFILFSSTPQTRSLKKKFPS